MRTGPLEATTGLSLRRLGERLRRHRAEHRLSLAALAARAGVSRSMLSAVERGAKAPTVLVLDRIATGLGTSIARLLGEERSARVVVLRRQEQDVGRDASGWERRILSPVLRGVEFEFMRTTIPPGVDAGEFTPHAAGSREYLAMERGALRLVLDGVSYLLRAGDSVYYAGDCTHAFANPGDTACVYYLVMDLVGERPRSHAPAPADEPARSPTGRTETRGGASPVAREAAPRGSR